MCGASPACRDGPTILGSVNVTTNVCARIDQPESTGGCEDYTRVFRAMVDAAPVLLEPGYSSTSPGHFCRVKAYARRTCASKLNEYARECAKPEVRAFCRRQEEYLTLKERVPERVTDPSAPTDASSDSGRIFESCSEAYVATYMDLVAEVNAACKDQDSFKPLSERGGSMLRIYSVVPWNASQVKTVEKWGKQCIMTWDIALAYAILSLVSFVAIFAVVALCRVCKLQLQWNTVADFVSDICQSRLFTAVKLCIRSLLAVH